MADPLAKRGGWGYASGICDLRGAIILLLLVSCAISRGYALASYACLNVAGLLETCAGRSCLFHGAAEDWLVHSLAWLPNNTAALRHQGMLAASRDRWADALASFRRGGLPAAAAAHRGDLARIAGEPGRALQWHRLALQLEPGDLETWYFIGLLNEQEGRQQEALAAYGLSAKSPTPIGCAASYRLGRIRYLDGPLHSDADALAAFRRVLSDECRPLTESQSLTAAHSAYWSGMIYHKQGDVNEADGYFQMALRHQPHHSDAAVMLGVMAFEATGSPVDAERYILPVIERSPEYKWPYYHLGRVYTEACQLSSAQRMFQRVLSIDPSDMAAQRHLQMVTTETGCDRSERASK